MSSRVFRSAVLAVPAFFFYLVFAHLAIAQPLSITAWTAIGPAPLIEEDVFDNVSGRITGLAVDGSDNIYLAAAGGGVWKSFNAGASWNALTDNQPTLSMGAIAVAPSNGRRIYAGTGEANNSPDSNFGVGILISTDGGATWTLSTGPNGVFNRLAISKISVHPANELIAYAAVNDYAANGLCCANTGIYKTIDGGTTWINVTALNGKDSLYPWSDVVVDPNTPSIIYAAHGNVNGMDPVNGIYRSIDSGATWNLLTNAPFGKVVSRIALAVAPSASVPNQHVLYAAMANIGSAGFGLYAFVVSNNADAPNPTFTTQTNTPDFLGGANGQGQYDIVIGVDRTDWRKVYAAGEKYTLTTGHVICSNDGGNSWSDITSIAGVTPHSDSHAMAFDSRRRLLLGNDGGIWRYTPGIDLCQFGSWTNLNSNLNTIQFYGVGLHPTSTTVAVGGSQDNGTEVFSGGLTWQQTSNSDGGRAQISPTNPSRWYGQTPFIHFIRNDNSGAAGSWSVKTSGLIPMSYSNSLPPYVVDPSNGDHLLIGLDRVYETTNGGDLWNPISSPAVAGFNNNGNRVDSVALAPGTTTFYAATGGLDANISQIFMTTNGGTSWIEHDLPVSGRVNEIDIDPNDATGQTAYAVINRFNGASGTIYRTVNGGATWTNISGNLPQIPAFSLKVDTNPSHTIYVSTEAQVYSSNSPYGSWSVFGSGLPNAQGLDLELNRNKHLLAVGTHGRGMWEILTQAATVMNVTSSNANGNYVTGQPISIQVTFSAAVTVTGMPLLALNSGGTASYASGNGTTTLTFNYVVGGTDKSFHLDYTSANALTLNGGSITSGATVVLLSLPVPGSADSLGASKSISINGTTVTNVTSLNLDGEYTTGQTVSVQVTFSDNVTVTGSPQLALNSSGTAILSSAAGSTLTFNYLVGAGDLSLHLDYISPSALTLNGGTIKDSGNTPAVLTLPAPGTAGSLGANKNISINHTIPMVISVTSLTPDGDYGIFNTILIEVDFSEPVFVTGTPLLALNSGGIAHYTSGSGMSGLIFTYYPETFDSTLHLDESSSIALMLNGGTIKNSSSVPAALTVPAPGAVGSLGANSNISITPFFSFFFLY
jgi:photosystem II stability/assembly factor-like uncharacterized protein